MTFMYIINYVIHNSVVTIKVNSLKHLKCSYRFIKLANLLLICRLLIVMEEEAQYTFLEAIYMDCALVLSSKWVEGVKTPFRHGVNCFIVSNADELRELLTRNPDTKKIVKNAKRMLAPHLRANGW